MDYKPLPVGIDNFEKLVTGGYYFVDKTLLIKELLDKKSDVNLFTRPRRFGKTLNMSMMRYFFEDARDSKGNRIDNSGLYEGMNILQAGEKYLAHMGKYPVISLTLKEAGQTTYEDALQQIRYVVADEYKRHEYILTGDLSDADKSKYLRFRDEEADAKDYNSSLKFLSQCLEKYYGRKVIILIDEYDVPLESAYMNGYYTEMAQFIRTLFSSALKTNESLAFAVLTGCLRISKESIFTGLNNLEVISILNKNYDEYFGFTEAEVRKICEDYDMPDLYSLTKEWYNGYLFGDCNVYNPWSTVLFVKDQLASRKTYPQAYWMNTSSNSIVRKLIDMADDGVKREIEELIAGGTIEKPVHEDITYDEVYNSMDNLWNFMFFTGYFRKVSERVDEEDTLYLTLTIPNREVRCIFRNKVMAWVAEQTKARNLSVLHTAVVNKDVQTMEEELNDILLTTISYMDANESYYHGMLAGLLTGIPGYRVKSNREGGTGRSDLMLLPVVFDKEAFVFEFKRAPRIRQLDEMADAALQQIDDRKYRQQIYDDGYDIISSYGVSFCGKRCRVKWRE